MGRRKKVTKSAALDEAKSRAPKPAHDQPVSGTGVRPSRIRNGKVIDPKELLEAEARENSAVEMRNLGASFQEIADELGYASRGGAQEAFYRGFERISKEMAAPAAELVRRHLMRLTKWRKSIAIQGNESGDQIAAAMAGLNLDKQELMMFGLGPGSAAQLMPDATPVNGTPSAANGGGNGTQLALPDPKFEYERIQKINAVLLESGVHQVPLQADDSFDDSKPPDDNGPQETKPELGKVTGAHFSAEDHDFEPVERDDHELL